mgnify:CR=1 FL=1
MQQLPNARLLVHQRGARHMIDPSALVAGATAVYGEAEIARSYGAIAQVIGRPTASRAVGAANGRNPLSIVVPCHRVIGGGGALTGFAGGLAAKTWLLEHERRHAPGAQLHLLHA